MGFAEYSINIITKEDGLRRVLILIAKRFWRQWSGGGKGGAMLNAH